ncbi:MAG: translation initiation factor IF-2 [Oscillospiraceae bacterium]|jgi:translation initiation factor IF-2|nr:translation initiation factor IF-2 [Oscillospiraceae bacterium]
MGTIIKYRVHELARDFNIPTKDIAAIMKKYTSAPKTHMQVLTPEELDIIFQVVTASHQVDSIGEIYADTEAETPAEATAMTEADATAEGADTEATATEKPAAAAASSASSQTPPKKEAKITPDNPAPKREDRQERRFVPRTAPEKRVIDTSGATMNIAKYDEKHDNLVPKRAENMNRGREKWGKKNQTRAPAAASSAKRRNEERDRMQRLQLEIAKKAPLTVQIPDEISVGELASRMKKSGAEVVRNLMKLGVMAAVSDVIDYETAALVAIEMGCKVKREVVVTIEDRLIDVREDTDAELMPRAPVVVVMGHVDHGKTTLLDKIRSANVASGEAGGITQHIGAYSVSVNGSPITFLDTPGHEAFTAMRARGAMITDIAVLVIAADDGIMPQTIESISHAKAAEIPIIVAINRIDTPGANIDKIKQQLTEYELVSEEWGGDTIICPVSAKTGEGIDELLQMIALTAEMSELRANPNRTARGTVIEARLDRGRGPVMTVLVQNGILKVGDLIIAGTAVGKVRVMTNDRGERVSEAGPSVPVEITGMSEVPEAGEQFNAVSDERMARDLAEQRRSERKNASAVDVKVSLDDFFAQLQQGEVRDLNIIIKADVQGSAEAIKSSIEKLSDEEVRVRVIHSGVGAVSESDVMLAATSAAIIIAFNVRPDNAARDSAIRSGVDIRQHSIIYDCIREMEAAVRGLQAPKYRESVIGHAEVRQIITVSNVGTVAGSYVQDGRLQRGCMLRVLRDGELIHTGQIGSLRRFKDDVREVATNYECGVTVDKFNDILEGDILEAFVMEQINN